MSKTLTFTVSVTFQDKITGYNEVLKVAENIGRAIELECGGMGIAPESSETFTRSVSVKPQFIDETITKKIV